MSQSNIKNVIIIGAGASGLSVAWGLAGKRNIKVTILESEKEIGGLSKSIERYGIRFDIGPHRFSPILPEIIERVYDLLGEDLVKRKNIHSVYYDGTLYAYPPTWDDFFNPSSLRRTFVFGTSWLLARSLGSIKTTLRLKQGNSFNDILLRNFGRSFCDSVIFPMICKVWGTEDLDSEFAKIRFEEPTFGKMLGKIIFKNSTKDVFYYPIRGYGQIWNTIGGYLKKQRQVLEVEAQIDLIETESLNGPFKILYTQKNINKIVEADILVSTIPNRYLINYLSKTGLVNTLLPEVENFKSRTLRLGVFVVRGFHLPSRVVIFPEAKFIFNRISEMNQFSDFGYDRDKTVLLVDVICDPGSEYDLMKEEEFNQRLLESLLMLNWFKKEDMLQGAFSLSFPDAYPVLNKRRYNAQEVLDRNFARTGIILCGREASSDYNNAHNAMCKAFFTARYISGEIDFERYQHYSKLIGRLPIQD